MEVWTAVSLNLWIILKPQVDCVKSNSKKMCNIISSMRQLWVTLKQYIMTTGRTGYACFCK